MKKGLIGYPLGHSYSKQIHEQLAPYTYECNEVNPDEFDLFMKSKNFEAINVTIPYKQQVIPYLDYLDKKAKKVGAVNTIVNRNNQLIGYNTDYFGFWWLLKNNEILIKDKKIAVLGNGGATKACVEVMKDGKAKECLVVSRAKSENTITYDELIEQHSDIEILINATPVGMHPEHNAKPIDLEGFCHVQCVVDIIYNPSKTKLMLQAESLGIKAVGGLEMLVAQAAEAVKIFTGHDIEENDIKRIINRIQRERENIVFIGMPSSGKSTLAKAISKAYGFPLIDLDKEIVKVAGKSIPKIFEEDGEDVFRNIESKCISDICMKEGYIISTGGGVVKREINIEHLKKKGFLIWVDRDVNLLISDESRPLSKNREAIEKLYIERKPLYQKASDIRLENHESINKVIKQCSELLESRKMK